MKEPLFNSSDELTWQQKQAEKLAEIGEKLRQTREKKLISLEKLALKTMIRSHLLEAIEEGNLEQLPEGIYIQHLIERYGNAVELDGKQLANLFPIKSEKKSLERDKVYLHIQRLKAHHLYLVYVLVVIFSIHFLSKASLLSFSPEEIGTSDRITVTNGEVEAKTEDNGAGSARLVGGPSNNSLGNSAQKSPSNSQDQNKPVRVSVIVQEDSWVSVEIDGKIEFEGTLPRGTEKTWQAQEKLVFLAGNAGGVLVAFNNGQAKQLGAPGAVEELVWNADNPNYPGSQEFQN